MFMKHEAEIFYIKRLFESFSYLFGLILIALIVISEEKIK